MNVAKRLKLFVIDYISRRHVRAVTLDDIITITSKGWFVSTYRLSEEEIKSLKDQAATILKLPIWKFMKDDLEWQAWNRMAPPKVPDDIIFGSAMFYSID